jgi:cell division FtsZ-interacting protein ZapD
MALGIWIVVVIGVFFAGAGISYVIIPSGTPDVPVMMTPQQMQQMMDEPSQMIQWHQTMMNDPQAMNIWMDVILNEPKLRQQLLNKMNQEGMKEFQESGELNSLLEKTDLRVKLLKQMESHNQNLINLVPHYTDDPNLNEMMTEKMIEHNYLMNQLLGQENIGPDSEESIKEHMQEHQELAEMIASLNQNGQNPK